MAGSRNLTSCDRAAVLCSFPGLEKAKAFGFRSAARVNNAAGVRMQTRARGRRGGKAEPYLPTASSSPSPCDAACEPAPPWRFRLDCRRQQRPGTNRGRGLPQRAGKREVKGRRVVEVILADVDGWEIFPPCPGAIRIRKLLWRCSICRRGSTFAGAGKLQYPLTYPRSRPRFRSKDGLGSR